jgi:hypothetical protein
MEFSLVLDSSFTKTREVIAKVIVTILAWPL